MADMTTLVHANANIGHSTISHTLSRLAVSFSDWRAAMATRRELNKLSDIALEDIGLSRGDIDTMKLYR
jgi:uncharacterized protein YjiS (DUF1127 family)